MSEVPKQTHSELFFKLQLQVELFTHMGGILQWHLLLVF